MRSHSPANPSVTATAVTVVANLLPLWGVWVGDLAVGSLLVIYWVEGGATVLFATVKALLAQQGSPDVAGIEPLSELREKRGGVSLRAGWPPVYPRNLPFALSVLGLWTAAVVPASAAYWVVVAPQVRLTPVLALGISGLLIAQGREFRFDYLRKREYTDTSAREILLEPTQIGLLLAVLGFIGMIDERLGGPLVLSVLVLVKTGATVRQLFVEHPALPVPDRLEGRFTETDLAETAPEIDPPDGEPQSSVAVAPSPVLLAALPTVALGFLHRGVLGVFALLGFAVLVAGPVWLAPCVAVVLIVVGARIGSYYLRYGTIEYRRHEEYLVAHDTLLDAPQWVVPVDGARFSVRNAATDRLLGTGTLEIERLDPDDTSVQFGPVADLDAAVETLDLPVVETDRPERDPAVIAAALLLALSLLVVPAGLLFSPAVSDAELAGLAVAIGPMFLLPVVALVWVALRWI
ncbi:DUF6498-containing protein [Haloarcula halophila]|uniref:DUF6498-containing protein n=1 Tax=Haloarcula TaxID=2237 RepID=UPI0023E38F0B|nr:DUF6498-containing protein [Halomicroarcula sp. DFY41]